MANQFNEKLPPIAPSAPLMYQPSYGFQVNPSDPREGQQTEPLLSDHTHKNPVTQQPFSQQAFHPLTQAESERPFPPSYEAATQQGLPLQGSTFSYNYNPQQQPPLQQNQQPPPQQFQPPPQQQPEVDECELCCCATIACCELSEVLLLCFSLCKDD